MKHYIRLDGTKIIKGFSDAFEQPQIGDICINENGDRHFMIGDVINPAVNNEQGIALYKYEGGKVAERTEQEIEADIAKIPAPEPSEVEKLRAEVDAVKAVLVEKNVITTQEKESLSQK